MMKKTLLAMTVAGVVAVPSANAITTLYGALNQTVSQVDSVSKYGDTTGTDYSATRVHDNTSKLGVKGSEDLGRGLSAIYQIEYGLGLNGSEISVTGPTAGDTSSTHKFSQRNAFVGLKGGFGTVLAGRHDVPAKIALGKVAYAVISSGSGHSMGDAANIGFGSQIRANNALAYVSPNMNGFTFAGATVAGEEAEDAIGGSADGLADGYSAALMYSNGPLYVGLGFTSLSSDLVDAADDTNISGLAIKYAPGPWEIGYLYENTDGGSALDIDRHYLYTGFGFGDDNKVYLQYGMAEGDYGTHSYDRDVYGIAFKHSLSKRTSLWAAYTANDNDYSLNSDIADGSIASLGMMHQF